VWLLLLPLLPQIHRAKLCKDGEALPLKLLFSY
jgi:hypothetical protein